MIKESSGLTSKGIPVMYSSIAKDMSHLVLQPNTSIYCGVPKNKCADWLRLFEIGGTVMVRMAYVTPAWGLTNPYFGVGNDIMKTTVGVCWQDGASVSPTGLSAWLPVPAYETACSMAKELLDKATDQQAYELYADIFNRKKVYNKTVFKDGTVRLQASIPTELRLRYKSVSVDVTSRKPMPLAEKHLLKRLQEHYDQWLNELLRVNRAVNKNDPRIVWLNN